jgi:hypothetical protein
MAFGRKSGRDVPDGDKMTGRQAKRATGSGGGLRDDGKVVNQKGKVVGDFSKRTPKKANEHGV